MTINSKHGYKNMRNKRQCQMLRNIYPSDGKRMQNNLQKYWHWCKCPLCYQFGAEIQVFASCSTHKSFHLICNKSNLASKSQKGCLISTKYAETKKDSKVLYKYKIDNKTQQTNT